MLKQIDLSIITINYNNLSGLTKTMESVLSQKARNFEHIVVDGLSTDGSKNYLESFKKPPFIFISEKDDGIYFAQNKGIEKARGKYVLFLNSGDTLASANTIDEIFSYRFESDLIYGNMFIESSSNIQRLGKQPKKLTLTHLMLDTIWHPSCLIRRDLFKRFGLYDTNFKIVADYEFWLRIFSSNQITTTYIPIPFSKFDLKGLSSDPENQSFISYERRISQAMYYNRFDLFFYRDIPLISRFMFRLIKALLRKTLNPIFIRKVRER
ncbi:glycosyltransferase family 2 protein [Leptospira sanjuanensis]|uniref:glycosyltransferase family 2 protein n=1 Tax=Leptospira sanjuanensis TaxID=2879643 RepID=UPI0029E82252|nr:glycosyltransferase family 2 protein [Leptospira sanjuanensis]